MCHWVATTEPDENGLRMIHCSTCDRGLPTPTSAPLDAIVGCLHRDRIPEWCEFGEWAQIALEAVCVTKATLQRFGIKCGCSQRQHALNELGEQILPHRPSVG